MSIGLSDFPSWWRRQGRRGHLSEPSPRPANGKSGDSHNSGWASPSSKESSKKKENQRQRKRRLSEERKKRSIREGTLAGDWSDWSAGWTYHDGRDPEESVKQENDEPLIDV